LSAVSLTPLTLDLSELFFEYLEAIFEKDCLMEKTKARKSLATVHLRHTYLT
jgi:hypothetical protein